MYPSHSTLSSSRSNFLVSSLSDANGLREWLDEMLQAPPGGFMGDRDPLLALEHLLVEPFHGFQETVFSGADLLENPQPLFDRDLE